MTPFLSLFFKMHYLVACVLSMVIFFPEKPKLPEKKYYIDTNQIHLPKENMEMINPVKDGMSEYEYFD